METDLELDGRVSADEQSIVVIDMMVDGRY